MPMSPRLLRPRAGGVTGDSDVRNYIGAVEAADGQPLEQAVKDAIRDFILGCKTDNIWSAIKASCILMGARTLSGALTPLVGAAPTNNGPFVSADYNRKTGLVGNGSTKYINTNRNNSTDPQNSFHQAVYITAERTLGTHYIGCGAADLISLAGGSAIRNRGATAADTSLLLTGFAGHTRSTATAWECRFNGSTTAGPTTASSAPTAVDTYVFARNNTTSGASPAGYVNARMCFYSIGENLGLSLLDSRVTTLYNAIGAAIP